MTLVSVYLDWISVHVFLAIRQLSAVVSGGGFIMDQMNRACCCGNEQQNKTQSLKHDSAAD